MAEHNYRLRTENLEMQKLTRRGDHPTTGDNLEPNSGFKIKLKEAKKISGSDKNIERPSEKS